MIIIKENIRSVIKKYDVKNKIEQVERKMYLLYTCIFVFLIYGFVATPEFAVMKNTTLFIVLFFSALSMVILFYKRISPFKNTQPKKYVLTIIAVGYFISTFIENGYSKILVAVNGTSSTLNQEGLDTIFKNNPEQQFQYFSVVSILGPIGEEILYRGTYLAVILFLGKVFNVNNGVHGT